MQNIDINDGKVVHLVRRAPPLSTSSRSGSAPSSSNSSPRHNTRRRNNGRNDDNSYLVGAFSIPQEAFNPNSFQQMLQNVVSNMGDIGRNATVMSRTSEDGSSVDVQINLAQMPPLNEARQRLNQAKRFIGYINAIIDVIERPDSIPGVTTNESDSNISNGSLFGDVNSSQSQSLEAQLAAHAAQSIAAASNAFDQIGIPLVPGSQIIIQGSSSNSSQNQSNSSIRIAQPVIIQSGSINGHRSSDTSNANNNNTTNNLNNNNNSSSGNTNGSNSAEHVRPNFNSNNDYNATAVPASELNVLFNNVFQTQERLRPHIQRYQQLVAEEGALTEQQSSEAQNLQRNCMRATHHLAHIFHLISDLSINFSQPTRNVGVIQSLAPHSMESVSVSVPFASRQSSGETNGRTSRTPSTAATTDNLSSTTTASQQASEVAATAGSTTTSTTSVPRFSQSNSGGQSSSVFVAQSPIVVMEVGSTVERMPVPNSNGQRMESNQQNVSTPAPNPRSLFIPPAFDPFLQWFVKFQN